MEENPFDFQKLLEDAGIAVILFFVLKMIGKAALWFGNNFIIPVRDKLISFLDSLRDSLDIIQDRHETQEKCLSEIKNMFYDDKVKKLEDMKSTIEFYEKEIKTLKNYIQEHADNLSFIESYCENVPSPVWYKILDNDNDFVMAFINKAYEQYWHTSKEFYKGKKDRDVWGQEIADNFAMADLKVMKFKRAIPFVEKVPKQPGDNSELIDWLIWKFPIFKGTEVVGVGGMALDIDQICNFDAPKVRRDLGFDRLESDTNG